MIGYHTRMSGPGIRWLIFALICFSNSGAAQTSLPTTFGGSDKSDLEKILGSRSMRPTGTAGVFFEGMVDPNEYVVGPGDEFRLVFWKPTYSEVPAVVSADGDLIIPLVGIVRVAELTLADAKIHVNEAVSKALRLGEVAIVLERPRSFRVHVTGEVQFPGPFEVPATARIADAIQLAGGLKRARSYELGDTTSVVVASQRKIELRTRTGKLAGTADLLHYERAGDLKANPYCRDGQVIHVPAHDRDAQSFTVTGAVLAGGDFEYVPGDDLKTALELAGGAKQNAKREQVKVVSRSGLVRECNLDSDASEAVEAGDHILVTGAAVSEEFGSVAVTGEVLHPGGYQIRDGETTLRELLQACGGMLPGAAAQSVRLVRQVDDDPVESERRRLFANNSALNPRDIYFADEQLVAEFSRWDYGTVVLDMRETESLENEAGGTVLRNGDLIEVPDSPLAVRVLGSVNEAGEVPWISGEKLSYYLGEAGGRSAEGWKSRTVVVKARNGSQLRYSHKLSIDPGDVIFVPEKPVELTNWLSIKDIIAVTAQVATVVLVIQQVGK